MLDFAGEWRVLDAAVVGESRRGWTLAGDKGAWMKAASAKAKQVGQDGGEIVGIHGGQAGWDRVADNLNTVTGRD